MKQYLDLLARILEEGTDQVHCSIVHSQLVWTHHAARDEQRVEVVGARLREWNVHRYILTPVVMLPGPHARVGW